MRPRITEPLLRSVHAPAVRAAFNQVDRSLFVPVAHKSEAWADYPLPIEDGATISQPSLVAQMTDWLQLEPTHRVLEIGTGSGYQTALLAELADEIHTVECSERLLTSAQKRLQALGYSHLYFHHADGAQGWPEGSPYDRILATVAFPKKPDELLAQLSPNDGIALVPVGPPHGTQQLVRYERHGSRIHENALLPVRFLSLR